MSNTIRVPYLQGLDKATELETFARLLDATSEASGQGKIDTLNWPELFPYKPECGFRIGWCETGLGILYNVKGLDLRAAALEDNGPVWEDSCCEFFVADPADGTYYNFETNCIGTLLAAKRQSRENCTHYSAEVLSKVKRFSTLKHEAIDVNGKEFLWQLGIFVPFGLIGCKNAPETLQANFYKCGDKTAHVHFLSWSPVKVEKPDFHRPEFFGKLILVK